LDRFIGDEWSLEVVMKQDSYLWAKISRALCAGAIIHRSIFTRWHFWTARSRRKFIKSVSIARVSLFKSFLIFSREAMPRGTAVSNWIRELPADSHQPRCSAFLLIHLTSEWWGVRIRDVRKLLLHATARHSRRPRDKR
jgi:hypothetical protein